MRNNPRIADCKCPNCWRHVLWSDETKGELFGHFGRRYIWRTNGDVCSILTVKYGGGSIMLWGCFDAGGTDFSQDAKAQDNKVNILVWPPQVWGRYEKQFKNCTF
uniref:Uncharacterized protein n=1 Tax=Xiphophorus maculatus TaxID=8083 RepID=A0A3B5Q0Q6_XIPMA